MKIAAFYDNVRTGAQGAGLSLTEAVKILQAEGLELLYFAERSFQQDEAMIRQTMAETGIGTEGMYQYCFYADNPGDRGYESLIDQTAELGGTSILILPGFLPKDAPDYEQKRQNIVDVLRRAVVYGAEKGIAVSLEDCDFLESPVSTIAGLEYFFKEVPELRCALDTGNFIMYGDDEVAALDCFKDRLCTVHLKDRSAEPRNPGDRPKAIWNGTNAYPAVVGTGYIRVKEIIGKLKAMGYSKNLIVEQFEYRDDQMLEGLKNSVRWVREQWNA